MTIKEFFLKWNGVGCDQDGAYSFQCMDVYQQYNKEVTGAPVIPSNAIDVINKYPKSHYEFIANSPTNFPQEGDVILWTKGIGVYGHIAICSLADSNHFTSFEQNFPIGSICHFQNHNYTNVAGWLRPRGIIAPTVVINDQTKLPIGERPDKTLWGDNGMLECQAVLSTLNDQFETIKGLQEQIITYKNTRPAIIRSYNESSNVPSWIRRLFGDSVS